ncbi:hypothetical protein [Laceyella putida]|uniref:Uncharacterized protein n=1 Tax=Laceyella putida TaxID=110101 RepID=A0ABW2RPK7_9BACL
MPEGFRGFNTDTVADKNVVQLPFGADGCEGGEDPDPCGCAHIGEMIGHFLPWFRFGSHVPIAHDDDERGNGFGLCEDEIGLFPVNEYRLFT